MGIIVTTEVEDGDEEEEEEEEEGGERKYLSLQKQRSSSPATDAPVSISMLLTKLLRGCETNPRQLLSMLGKLGGGGAEISSKPKGAFLQAPSYPVLKAKEGLFAPSRPALLSATQRLRSAKH